MFLIITKKKLNGSDEVIVAYRENVRTENHYKMEKDLKRQQA